MTFARTVGALTLLWTAYHVRVPGAWPGASWWIASVIAYLVAGLWLLGGRYVRIGAGLLLLTALAQHAVQLSRNIEPLTLLAWFGLVLLVTEGRAASRALLVRVTVSCVYGATALAKLNPSFLQGESMIRIASTRPHMPWLADLPTGLLVGLSVAAIVTELLFAAGLWSARLRPWLVPVGIVFHTTLLASAPLNWTTSLTFLVILNVGLLAAWAAFWHPTDPDHDLTAVPVLAR